MKLFIVCNNCGTRISGLLDNQIVLDFIGKIEKELLSKGQYGIDDAGDLYISASDKHNLSYHHDQSRLVGCCGPSSSNMRF